MLSAPFSSHRDSPKPHKAIGSSLALLLLLGAPTLSDACDGGFWWSGFGYGEGMSYTVEALAPYQGSLAVGGWFVLAGTVFAPRVALWDGTEWSALGTGMNDRVYVLCEYNGDLIAAGAFTYAGDMPAMKIARWDGTCWHAMGAGLNGEVVALEVYGGKLYAGGAFTASGGIPTPYVAEWDGSEWRPVGGFNDRIWALTTYDGHLIAGGVFTNIGGDPARRIAGWDGTTWHPIGQGFLDNVQSLTVWNDRLIAGGHFPGHIAAWNGTWWELVGLDGLNARVWGLACHEGDLIAGGPFSYAGETEVDHIACWDGTNWHALGKGLNAGASDLCSHNGSLYAGGSFTEAGGVDSRYIARWICPASDCTANNSRPATTIAGIEPNPFSTATQVSYQVAIDAPVLLTIHDISGRLVKTIVDGPMQAKSHAALWTGKDGGDRPLPAGCYLVRLDCNGARTTEKIILAR